MTACSGSFDSFLFTVFFSGDKSLSAESDKNRPLSSVSRSLVTKGEINHVKETLIQKSHDTVSLKDSN